MYIDAAVEGIVDEAVVRRLVDCAGGTLGHVYGKNGKRYLRDSIKGFNIAARRTPWIVLVDLDRDFPCAPLLCKEWLPNRARFLCFRVAVRAVEAWLLADAEKLASFLGIERKKVPVCPETEEDPKAVMINLARASRRREIRDDMVPRPGSGRREGPA
ncbi:MAG: hypothetical protein QHJ34_13660 [bacterium]|jgi:hypothetical protein|nr:DUF4276 family protein [candidate division KSB1 bacterium]MDH7561258.1 hypothetical protein [bacterium]